VREAGAMLLRESLGAGAVAARSATMVRAARGPCAPSLRRFLAPPLRRAKPAPPKRESTFKHVQESSAPPSSPCPPQGPGLKTLLAEGARKGMWTPEFAGTHAFKSDPVIVEPDVTEVRFQADDEFLLMATDGLWDCMPAADAVQYARKQFRNGKDAQQVAEAMTSIALKRYTADNVAVIVVDLRRDKKPAAGSGGGKAGGGGGGGGLFGGLFGGR
jgi:hypothetical protein